MSFLIIFLGILICLLIFMIIEGWILPLIDEYRAYKKYKIALARETPIENRDEYGNTELMRSIQHGDIEHIKFLIKNGANVNATNKHLNTPLMYANYFEQKEIFDYLLQMGADTSLVNYENKHCFNFGAQSERIASINAWFWSGCP